MAKGIIRKLKKVLENVDKEINSHDGGFFSRGLASEGYAGGYRDALYDVMLALNDVKPNRHSY